MDVTEQFVGAWSLVSWTATSAGGNLTYPFGEDALGRIVYLAGGQMAAHVGRRRRTAFESDNPFEATAEERSTACAEYFSYYGSFTVEPGDGTVTHRVEGATYPVWIGKDQVRSFRFSNETLELSFRTDGTKHELVWKRM